MRLDLIGSGADPMRALLVLPSSSYPQRAPGRRKWSGCTSQSSTASAIAEDVKIKEIDFLPNPKKLPVHLRRYSFSVGACIRGGKELQKHCRLQLRWSNDSSRESTQRWHNFGLSGSIGSGVLASW
jgi:hypothetical protein